MDIAARLQMNPDHLMAAMELESAFNPKAVNQNSGATGLIQLTDIAIKDLNLAYGGKVYNGLPLTKAVLLQMSALTQLDIVEKYFARWIKAYGKLQTAGDVYMAIAAPGRLPAALGRPDDFVVYAAGTPDAEENPPWWVSKTDHNVTKASLARAITTHLVAGLKTGNVGYLNEVVVVNREGDHARIDVSPTSGLVTNSSGGTAAFTVRLTSKPALGTTVVVGIQSSNKTEGKVSASSLTFNRLNWRWQQIIVTGLPGKATLADVPYTIVTAAAVSGDKNYGGQNPANVAVVNRHNLLSGTWQGNYTDSSTGGGGFQYNSKGTLRFSLALQPDGTFSGSAFCDGIMLRWLPSGDFYKYTSSTGTVTAKLTGTKVEGTFRFPIAETGATMVRTFTATVRDKTLVSGILRSVSGSVVGSFSANKIA